MLLLLCTIIVSTLFKRIPLSHASFVQSSPTNNENLDDYEGLQRHGNKSQLSSHSSLSLSKNLRRSLHQTKNKKSVSWLQLGNDIDGALISLSDDGMRVVARASSTSSGPGLIARVYEQDINGGFIQVGNSIDYAMYDELSKVNGYIESVDISSDGKRVIVGTTEYNNISRKFPFARIFEEVNGSWIQIGNAIEDGSSDDFFYTESKISGDGRRAIVGSVWPRGDGDDAGHVRVFEEQNKLWVQLGEIKNSESSAKAGHDGSFDISKDGKRIITGVYFDPSYYSYETGVARIFEEKDGTWDQVGDDIEGFSDDRRFTTFSISLSGNGKRLIVGATGGSRSDVPYYIGSFARIFEEKNGEWAQIGSDIDGEKTGPDFLGTSVDISDDGLSVAIGILGNDKNAENVGLARIYKETNGSWIPVGDDIVGDKAGDRLGYSVRISGDGNRIALKAGFITFQKLYSRVYELTASTVAPQVRARFW